MAEGSTRTVGQPTAGVASPSDPSPIGTPASISDLPEAEQVSALAEAKGRIEAQLRRRIVGQDDAVDLLLLSVFAGGHGLFVGVPGLAKTMLVQTLAQTLSLRFTRIQFTPDLMPSDITGTDVLDEQSPRGGRSFRFIPGPVFTNILLADEVNRTPPKTQSALLESMAEGSVTAGGTNYRLEQPYLVFATQNPIEQQGTYPLPEAQMDRFLLQIDMGYPSADEEEEIVLRTTAAPGPDPEPVLDRASILSLQGLIPRIPVAPHVIKHAVALTRASRPDSETAPEAAKNYLRFGAGPRASQALVRGAKARAALQGRFSAEIDDVRALALPALRHRLVPSFRADSEGVSPADVVEELLRAVKP